MEELVLTIWCLILAVGMASWHDEEMARMRRAERMYRRYYRRYIRQFGGDTR